MIMFFFEIFTLIIVHQQVCSAYFAGLYPYESETREVKSLNGLWNFKISSSQNPNEGFTNSWFKSNFEEDEGCIKMPVPASYNDITTNKTIRDFLGVVWYQYSFFIPKRWIETQQAMFIRFGSVHYLSHVWLNDTLLGTHEGGHLPFQFELHGLKPEGLSRLTVAVNNTLTENTIPQGFVTYPNNSLRYPPGYTLYSHNFDYFDYAGINRPVTLYTTPMSYIVDINVVPSILDRAGFLTYTVLYFPSTGDAKCNVTLFDKHGKLIDRDERCNGVLKADNATFWWPVNSGYETVGYMYTLEARIQYAGDSDIYRMPVGIRTLKWDSNSLYINNKPIYLKGFGMHEDADIRGRGFDYSILVRDMNLIKWTGANVIRTSHYPYSEEFLNLADELGILVILESPACSLSNFSEILMNKHREVLYRMVEQHRNRPSVIMWSLANEPYSNLDAAGAYFRYLKNLIKTFDETRPITFVTSQSVENDKAVEFMDVICVNRYNSWYSDPGHTDLIQYQVVNELTEWYKKFTKPVIITEYGAGAITGLHTLPDSMWSEDYQAFTIYEHAKAFEILRGKGFLAGELVWNLKDFNTPEGYTRPGRNCKGLFTRDRQPKEAAHLIKKLYEDSTRYYLESNEVEFMDFICVNRYSSWYQDSGHSDLIQYQVVNELTAWHLKYYKPVIMTEYGAGSIAGLHMLPESMWSEEYQVVTINEHTTAFNILRDKGFLAGEMIWNFIDFNTPQEYIRPGRCSKGLFTRNRQPKEAAYLVKKLYESKSRYYFESNEIPA